MSEIDKNKDIDIYNSKNGISELSEDILMETREIINNSNALKVPISELSTLGTGVSSIIPSFNSITQTTTFATDGLYRVVNASPGDVLKVAKNGNSWGAMKTAKGTSKMAQFKEIGPLSSTTKTVSSFNPSTIMMAVALYSIEKDLREISETQKKILTFLEVENESQIEADVESLMEITSNYKYNWDNEISIASSYNLITDIKNRSRKNMIVYQKKVSETVSSKKFIIAQNSLNSVIVDLDKKFKYYRLSLYIFSLSSLMEIMLSGNFKEDYIDKSKCEIQLLSDKYREQFEKSSFYIEQLSNSAIGVNVVKGIGSAGNSLGKMIGSIPVVKKGKLDEFLQDKGSNLHENSIIKKKNSVKSFASLSNPGTRLIINKLDDMIQIYNKMSNIYIDKENIYLLP